MMIMTTIVSCIWPFLVNSMEHRTHFSCTAIHFLMWYNEREREWANVRLTLLPYTTCHMILYGHGWCSVRRIKGPYEKRKKSIERWINENGTERNGRAETQALECARTPLVSAHFSFAACNSNGNFHLSGYHAFCPHFYSCCLSFTLSLSKKASSNSFAISSYTVYSTFKASTESTSRYESFYFFLFLLFLLVFRNDRCTLKGTRVQQRQDALVLTLTTTTIACC